MPAKLDRCVYQVKDKVRDSDSAWAICTASLKRNGALKKEALSPRLLASAARQAGLKSDAINEMAIKRDGDDARKLFAKAEKLTRQRAKFGMASLGAGNSARRLFGLL